MVWVELAAETRSDARMASEGPRAAVKITVLARNARGGQAPALR